MKNQNNPTVHTTRELHEAVLELESSIITLHSFCLLLEQHLETNYEELSSENFDHIHLRALNTLNNQMISNYMGYSEHFFGSMLATDANMQ
jgi:hypothetical protein